MRVNTVQAALLAVASVFACALANAQTPHVLSATPSPKDVDLVLFAPYTDETAIVADIDYCVDFAQSEMDANSAKLLREYGHTAPRATTAPTPWRQHARSLRAGSTSEL